MFVKFWPTSGIFYFQFSVQFRNSVTNTSNDQIDQLNHNESVDSVLGIRAQRCRRVGMEGTDKSTDLGSLNMLR